MTTTTATHRFGDFKGSRPQQAEVRTPHIIAKKSESAPALPLVSSCMTIIMDTSETEAITCDTSTVVSSHMGPSFYQSQREPTKPSYEPFTIGGAPSTSPKATSQTMATVKPHRVHLAMPQEVRERISQMRPRARVSSMACEDPHVAGTPADKDIPGLSGIFVKVPMPEELRRSHIRSTDIHHSPLPRSHSPDDALVSPSVVVVSSAAKASPHDNSTASPKVLEVLEVERQDVAVQTSERSATKTVDPATPTAIPNTREHPKKAESRCCTAM